MYIWVVIYRQAGLCTLVSILCIANMTYELVGTQITVSYST